VSRNNLLFGVMQRMGLVERIGSGIGRMREQMKEYGLKEPEIEADENWFTIVFRRPKPSPAAAQKTTQKILDAIRKDPYITRRELAKIAGVSEDGVKFHINRLKSKGLLKRVGPDKGGYWEVMEKGKPG